MKRRNIPIFVPHMGCPHRCSFCDQRAIAATEAMPSPAAVTALLADALNHLGAEAADAEIAFFGGSFTAIPPALMTGLLKAAKPFVGSGRFRGIRLSTRPDAISSEILTTLGSYGVTAIELGAQSMDDAVLCQNGRGHRAADTETAAALIRAAGFELGLQMMTGLAGDSPEGSYETACRLIALWPDTVRIYPTIVIAGTELARLYAAGEYTPQPLDEAVADCARLLALFEGAGIPVIKLGLHAGPGIEAGYVAGPYHPAFRQLCESRLMLSRLIAQLPPGYRGGVTVAVHPADVSNMAGHKGASIHALAAQGMEITIQQDDACRRLWPLVTELT